jgi:hypothetical protein
MNTSSISRINYRNFLALSLAVMFCFANSTFAAATAAWDSGIADPTGGGAPGLWTGVTKVTGLIYGVIWIACAVVIGMGWFKWKQGDVSAAIFHITGGAGLGFTPMLIQWFRGMNGAT